MQVSLYTLGCKVNYCETEKLKAEFEDAGFKIVNSTANKVDVFVLNSCAVTAKSEAKVRQILSRTRNKYKESIIVLTGCCASIKRQADSQFNNVDIIVPNNKKHELVSIVKQYINTHNLNKAQPNQAEQNTKAKTRTRAFLKIQDGCNRYCSYCIIPYARPIVSSKPLAEIKQNIFKIAANGYKEVVFVGINLLLFGKDTNCSLLDVIEIAAKQEKIKRIRFGSLEPEVLTLELIQKLAQQTKFCPHFHISLQSGADKILKAMNRHYTTKEYNALIELIRSHFKNAAITTDIIVGFPGETEEDFQASLNFVHSQNFSKIHVFPYSIRSGTRAATMPNQVDNATKLIRTKLMLKLAETAQTKFNNSLLGTKQTVLFEGNAKAKFYYGHAPNYVKVCVESQENITNQILEVKITSANKDGCFGILL
ncbi:MAG: tRNA (N(6)-L-threonylcarbamoyladenosine(37)-C(2))-methylthiotransferase MtaB [Oscillospiraceae bacterium]|nr:tRNA (N(6)-L-threonylcarbamoyladenosine(37)-C(2))-methylthiotransferase MtaB [Oscillospiraceae bacterium]